MRIGGARRARSSFTQALPAGLIDEDRVDAVLAGKKPSDKQMPSIGCNIKWIVGNEPDYFK